MKLAIEGSETQGNLSEDHDIELWSEDELRLRLKPIIRKYTLGMEPLQGSRSPCSPPAPGDSDPRLGR